jgi:hypothetical protein
MRLDVSANFMSDEERPAEWIWLFPDELNIWLDRVKEMRDTRFGNTSSDDDEPSGPVVRNELAERFRRDN